MALKYSALLAFCIVPLCTALSHVRSTSAGKPRSGDAGNAGSAPALFNLRSVQQPATRHIAVLISGQLSRFIYKDSLRNVPSGLSWLMCGTPSASPRCTVDVYIVLANSSRTAGYGKYDGSPPYGDGAFTHEAIQQFYQKHGAQRVIVNFVANSTMERNFTEVERLIKRSRSKVNADADQWWNATQSLPRISRRWGNNGRMFLLRHAVYAAALDGQRLLPYSYSHFFYLREDNVFVNPPESLEALTRNPTQGLVMLDKYCGWNSKSDKLYLADRRGADVLFGPTLTDHVEHMASFLNRGLRLHEAGLVELGNSTKKWTLGRNDPMQSESFVEDLLNSSGTSIATYDFSRTEARYHKGTPCVFEVYFKCTREPGKVFPKCQCPYCN